VYFEVIVGPTPKKSLVLRTTSPKASLQIAIASAFAAEIAFPKRVSSFLNKRFQHVQKLRKLKVRKLKVPHPTFLQHFRLIC
jgi:hypothetical protein